MRRQSRDLIGKAQDQVEVWDTQSLLLGCY